MVDRPMVAIRNYGYRFIGTPVHPDPTHIRTAEQGDAVAHQFGDWRIVCLLRGHGSVVAANSVAEVFLDSLEMEENTRNAVPFREPRAAQADYGARSGASESQFFEERFPRGESLGSL